MLLIISCKLTFLLFATKFLIGRTGRETLKKNHTVSYICKRNLTRVKIMAKGPEKKTKNKALHTKLLNRKKAKLQEEKKERATRLKALVAKMNEKKSGEGDGI